MYGLLRAMIGLGGFIASLWALSEVHGEPSARMILLYACFATLAVGALWR